MITAAPFADRVVHQGLCHVIQPIFECGFIHESYANRIGKGTHRALARYEHYRHPHRYVLPLRIFRYVPAIDHGILKRDLRRRMACRQTLRPCDRIIDGSNPQEPVEHYFPGDDLFAPIERHRGLPIGNLTSQFLANVYFDPLEDFVKEVLRAPGYVRYVDDIALFHDDLETLRRWHGPLEEFLIGRRLRLHDVKTRIASTVALAEFVGFVTEPGRRRLPEANVRRFRNRLRSLRDQWRARCISRSASARRCAGQASDQGSARREGSAVILPGGPARVFVATKPVDFRKGLDGLSAVVQEQLKLDPFGGAIFVFRAKRADRVKILVWDGTGLTMIYKRLEGAKFSWPRIEDGVMRLSMAQLSALFEGLAWQRVHSRRVERPRAAQ